MHIDPLSSRYADAATRPAQPVVPASGPKGPDFRALMGQDLTTDRVELSHGIPASPPPEVLDQVQAAHEAYEDLRARGRELRFSNDDRTGQLVIEVRDLDGNTLSRIPPTEALAVASGSFR